MVECDCTYINYQKTMNLKERLGLDASYVRVHVTQAQVICLICKYAQARVLHAQGKLHTYQPAYVQMMLQLQHS